MAWKDQLKDKGAISADAMAVRNCNIANIQSQEESESFRARTRGPTCRCGACLRGYDLADKQVSASGTISIGYKRDVQATRRLMYRVVEWRGDSA